MMAVLGHQLTINVQVATGTIYDNEKREKNFGVCGWGWGGGIKRGG